MNSRYQKLFDKLKSENRGAFVPFVMLGDPNLKTSLSIMQTLIDAGADALELGIPFSDPIADGPTIQKAALRAFAAKVRPDDCFGLLAALRQKNPDTPFGLLTYANLVVHQDMDGFYKRCQSVGVDSVLVADVPTLEAEPFAKTARANKIDPVLIAAPNMDDDRLRLLAKYCGGYTYVVTRAGVTGADQKLAILQHDLIASLRKVNAPPAIFGFGISKPEHVRQALQAGAVGAISGSAVVAIIEKNLIDERAMLQELTEFVKTMRAATAGFS